MCQTGLYVAESAAVAHSLGCSAACDARSHTCWGDEPSFSPDGSRIAVKTPGIETITATPSIVNGTFECDRKAVASLGDQPTWSPDGRLIAYIASDANGRERSVYVAPADGTGPPKRIYHASKDIDSSALDWQCLGACGTS